MKPDEPVLRDGVPEDAGRLAVLATQVWLDTYATGGISDEIAGYVLAELTPDRFAAALVDRNDRLLVAEAGGALVGFAALRFDEPCPVRAAGSSVELRTLYVQAPFIGRGIGRALLDAARQVAHARSGMPLWLTVNARNDRAIGFYARQGYSKVGTDWFVIGASRHENHVLAGPAA